MTIYHFISDNIIKGNFSTSDIVNKTLKEHLKTDRDITITKDSSGKPKTDIKNVHISVSHSHNHAVLAVSDCRIGVDIELLREFDYTRIVNRFFSDKENEYISNNGLKAFFEIWTKKEARIKCFNSKLSECVFSNPCFENTITLGDLILSTCSEKQFTIKNIIEIHI